jgi:hypothetical protein
MARGISIYDRARMFSKTATREEMSKLREICEDALLFKGLGLEGDRLTERKAGLGRRGRTKPPASTKTQSA